MSKKPTDFRQALLREYEARQSKNALYSKRAFARDVGIAASTLSEHMNHGTVLGSKNLARVAAFLEKIEKTAETNDKNEDTEISPSGSA